MSEMSTVKAGTMKQARSPIRIGLAMWALAAATLGAGIHWLGMVATFEFNSPEFFPIASFFAFAFALFGTIQIGQGLFLTARHSKYGASMLEAGPAVLGMAYRGKIRTDRALEVSGPYTIRLLCASQAPSNSDGDTRGRMGRTPVWEASMSVPASTRSSTGIPFQFQIPADGLPNRRGSSVAGYTIYWSLSVSAPMAGLHYGVTFPIDVSATEDETDDDEGAPAGPTSIETAFVGEVKPEKPEVRLLRFILPVIGVLLFAAGAYSTANQWSHGRNGVALVGKITAINQPTLEVVLDGGGAVRIAYVTKHTTWQVGQPVRVTCLRDDGEMRSCRMDTGSDRWIDALGTLAVGTVLLLFGGWLWSRRRGLARGQPPSV